MPTYEYTCKNCGKNIEVFQSFSEKPLKKHDDCGGELQKVFHARGVVFKGSGFYATDSRKSSTSPAKSDSGKSDGAKTAKKAEKAESKTTKAGAKSD